MSLVNRSENEPKIKKMTQKEHILAKPGMYIGSCKLDTEDSYWVPAADGEVISFPSRMKRGKKTIEKNKKKRHCYDSDEEDSDMSYGSNTEDKEDQEQIEEGEIACGPKMEFRKIEISPGLYKLFDEILVNAADNKQRDKGKIVMDRLEVIIGSDYVTVRNNGHGISVENHEEYVTISIPELIFGHLLTSSNYDDNVKQTVGGTNGLGAKLVNIYSKRFEIQIEDISAGKSYHQIWTKNMSEKSKPIIQAFKGKQNSTSITFFPDFNRFGLEQQQAFNQGILELFRKRVFDIAATTGPLLKVYLNGSRVQIHSFHDYMTLYLGVQRPMVLERIHPRWQVGVSLNDTDTFSQVSFVNSIATARGGKHVDYMEELVGDALLDIIKRKVKSLKDTKPSEIKKHLFLFVNCLVFNPTFDSQTKSFCTSAKSDLQFQQDPVTKKETKEKVVLPDSFLKALNQSGVIAMLIEKLTERSQRNFAKTDGKKMVKRLVGIPKLEDANKAGTKDGHLCTLILTEGDSAKALAVSGLSIVGRNLYGVFPLKGKLLNVREASAKQILENSEVTAIKQIIGLKANVKYTDTKELRYGHVMIMSDQDHDGSHIKGLIINLFSHFWPSLLRLPGFLQEFITPIVKVSKGISASGLMSKSAKEQCFYTVPEYERWKQTSLNNNEKGWTIKYYKGLGTSTAVEAKSYFSDLDAHQLEFAWTSMADDEAIDMAFNRAKADARKEWLGKFKPGTYLEQSQKQRIPYSDFVHKELILFSMASNQRAIPSVIDGFKPGQRKILFAAFKRNLKKEIKVAQLAGYVSENTAYHHGEASLCATIVGLAANYVGSNNINLFTPNGQFGTRLQGGKDAASPRYIFTNLSQITRAIFPAADDELLTYLHDDGQSIEPEFYIPIVPMVLINGSSGIGTGWSSTVANYNPREIVSNLRTMIDIYFNHTVNPNNILTTEDMLKLEASFTSNLEELHPFYKGFNGVIKPQGVNSYIVKGVIEKLSDGSIHISELPLQKWTGDYKVQLEAMLAAGEIKEFREYHTDSSVSFVVELTPEQLHAYESNGMTLYKKFKLNSSLTTNNMVLFDAEGKLKKYHTANDILIEFFQVRMNAYFSRKHRLLQSAEFECKKLQNKARFILAVNSGEVSVKKSKKEIIASLDKMQYLRIAKKFDGLKAADETDQTFEDGEEKDKFEGSGPKDSDFDYLLSLPIWSLTKERAEALQKEVVEKVTEVEEIRQTTPAKMWQKDLTHFEYVLSETEALEKKIEREAAEKSLEKRIKSLKAELKNSGKKSDTAAIKKTIAALTEKIQGTVVVDTSDDFDIEKVAKARNKRKKVLDSQDDVLRLKFSGMEEVSMAKKEKNAKAKAKQPPRIEEIIIPRERRPRAARNIVSYAESEEEEEEDEEGRTSGKTSSCSESDSGVDVRQASTQQPEAIYEMCSNEDNDVEMIYSTSDASKSIDSAIEQDGTDVKPEECTKTKQSRKARTRYQAIDPCPSDDSLTDKWSIPKVTVSSSLKDENTASAGPKSSNTSDTQPPLRSEKQKKASKYPTRNQRSEQEALEPFAHVPASSPVSPEEKRSKSQEIFLTPVFSGTLSSRHRSSAKEENAAEKTSHSHVSKVESRPRRTTAKQAKRYIESSEEDDEEDDAEEVDDSCE